MLKDEAMGVVLAVSLSEGNSFFRQQWPFWPGKCHRKATCLTLTSLGEWARFPILSAINAYFTGDN
jgi:hypothetical protein